MGVLYHRRSPMDHLLELKELLRNGGQLVLETLIIEGKDNCRFHDFNQNDADKESTALVTRLTSKKDNYTAVLVVLRSASISPAFRWF